MRLLIHLRGVLSYPIHRFCFGSKALNSALVTRVVSDHHVPPGPFLIWERLNDWFLVGISHKAEYDGSGEAGKALGPLYSNQVSTKTVMTGPSHAGAQRDADAWHQVGLPE